MVLGKCPNCGANVLAINTVAQNQKVTLYTCENSKKEHDDSFQFVYTNDSTCNFRVYSNVFLKWNKRGFSKYEMKSLLENGQVAIRLYSKKIKGEYFKYAMLDKDYGVSILWDEEVQ
ncbi:hypothetical protein ACNSOL_02675 [Aliarcobacter lanthieri]|uniref:hypothetical protein n=1 Tax=Arcobacteraceae TaxID=2808963 RepID=UPI000DE964C6|nr:MULTISPECIES: hypothetical protein [Arcobacteraceae]MBL3519372.1 hypothetical protein [Aliarcobacter lanthieri]RBQ27070.1 hypothetical protein CRU88_04850 [Arcobacter sp. CECT 9188]